MTEQKYIVKPSTYAYDGMNTIEEILGEYDSFLGLLSNRELVEEYKIRRSEFLDSPTIYNVRTFDKIKSVVLQKGLIDDYQVSSNYETERENY